MVTKRTRPRSTRLGGASALALAALVLAACGGGADEALPPASSSIEGTSSGGSSTAAIAQPASAEGRLLASNCFQCHGTLGLGGFDKIRGDESKEVLEFATKAADRDIMAAHAQGYTPEQLRKIIAYLQQ